jgi:hypothetical protein
MADERFKGDELPDATWGICGLHGLVRLVDECGLVVINGICQLCYAEANSDGYFSCPTHGIQPVAKGARACPFPGCLGVGTGPSADEVERLAREDCRVWPGGPPVAENAVDAREARPARERDREVGDRPADEAGELLRADSRGGGEAAPERDNEPLVIQSAILSPEEHAARPEKRAPERSVERWTDPFLIEEP